MKKTAPILIIVPLILLLTGITQSTDPEVMTLLIGTYTGSGSEGIYQTEFNSETGELSNLVLLAALDNPSFLHQSKDLTRVYAVKESQPPGSLVVLGWNEDKSQLIQLNEVSSGGVHPCFIESNQAGTLLAAANYTSGEIGVYALDQQGDIGGKLQSRSHNGSGPVMPNQQSAHAHCSRFGPSGKYLYSADLGADKIFGYPVDPSTGIGDQEVALELTPGDGPRHIAFHPEQPYLFVINELSNTIVSTRIDEMTGKLTHIDRKSTLPTFYEGKSYCADIHCSADGKFLYASNRGHNSIAVFSVSEEGMLTLLQTESVRGDWPRNFAISPDGKFLLVANQRSDNIAVFKIDPETGMIRFTGEELEMSQPVCLKF